MVYNINVGILGHVDSGKTTLAKCLSEVASTAAFDKNPQSQTRGITLDLGFSALTLETPPRLKQQIHEDKTQLTFVDCPGHASLIRTIIGGAQIIDLALLVIDVQKGIQTQTAECLVIAEITCKNLIVVINKIDVLEDETRSATIEKLEKRLRKSFGSTTFGTNVPIARISAVTGENVGNLIDLIQNHLYVPKRNAEEHFLYAVDHCFAIKGQGTVCTGTVLQGSVRVNDLVEIPHIKETRKVKSMQMFREPVNYAEQGDRVGICIAQLDPGLIERGILAHPGIIVQAKAILIQFNRIKHYKGSFKSRAKFHISVGHETVMGNVIFFKSNRNLSAFDIAEQYEYIQEIEGNDIESENGAKIFVLIEFETIVPTLMNTLIIGSKLDINSQSNSCRIAFWGNIEHIIESKNYNNFSKDIKVYKTKLKSGTVQRLVNEHEIIVQNLFKKETNRDMFIGLSIEMSTGEKGFIESTFGTKDKVKVRFLEPLLGTTVDILRTKSDQVEVLLRFKKFLFNKDYAICQ